MMRGEIDFLSDFDWNLGRYYEVELWKNGDCNSRFFKTKATALKCFAKFGSSQYDCIKFHHSGNCEIVREFGE